MKKLKLFLLIKIKATIFLSLTLILLCIPKSINAQQRHSIYFDFFQYFNFYQVSLGLGYDYEINNSFSIDFFYGHILPRDALNQNEEVGRTNGKGYKIAVFPKYLFEMPKERLFIGLSNYFISHEYQSNQYVERDSEEIISYKVSQKIIGSDFVFGLKPSTDKIDHYFFEASIGLGFKFYMTKNDLNEPLFELAPFTKETTLLVPEENGKHFKLSLPISLKMGWRF